MSLEKTNWGQIQWIESELKGQSDKRLHVGIVTLGGKKSMPPHLHYEEQVLYILEGQGITYQDDVSREVKAGDILHLPMGIIHKMINLSEEPLIHLHIARPYESDGDTEYASLIPSITGRWSDTKWERPDFIRAVEATRTQFLARLRYVYAIFDASRRLVLASDRFPAYCTDQCQSLIPQGKAPCMVGDDLVLPKVEHTYQCPYGVTVFSVPCHIEGQFLGFILGGFIYQPDKSEKTSVSYYDTPRSTIYGINNLLRKISKAIQNYLEFSNYMRQMDQLNIQVDTYSKGEQVMAEELRSIKSQMLNLQINRHFLFNTLNQMASMAFRDDNMLLYNSIVNLSKLMQHSQPNDLDMIALEEEISTAKAYLDLQKIRFPDLNCHCSIDQSALSYSVPGNFLLPILENAFIHGFIWGEEKKLNLTVKRSHSGLDITISNSGKKLLPQQIETISDGMKSETSHGLSMVYGKLRNMYQGEEKIQLNPLKDGGLEVHLYLPIDEEAV